MQLGIADTGPINYLILIGHIDVLPALFQKVILPSTVRDELHDGPATVRNWIAAPPSWVEVRQAKQVHNPAMKNLDVGESDAIALAIELQADLLLMDDRDGVRLARLKGLVVTGTLGVLGRAARFGLLDLPDTFNRLKDTNFRYRQETMDDLLKQSSGKQSKGYPL